jgi:hypothetical protein
LVAATNDRIAARPHWIEHNEGSYNAFCEAFWEELCGCIGCDHPARVIADHDRKEKAAQQKSMKMIWDGIAFLFITLVSPKDAA